MMKFMSVQVTGAVVEHEDLLVHENNFEDSVYTRDATGYGFPKLMNDLDVALRCARTRSPCTL